MRAEELREPVGPQEVAPDLVLKIGPPVESDRAGDVRLGIEGRVLVDLDDPYPGVAEMLLHPPRLDQDVFRVAGHR